MGARPVPQLALRLLAPLAAVLLALAVASPAAAGTRPDGVERALRALVATGVPGAVVLARDGARVEVAAAGVANRASGTPMRASTRVRIGRLTRTFVAVDVLKLVAAGRLALDEPVARADPGLLPAADGTITVRQLLQQTTGLPDYRDRWRSRTVFWRAWTPRQLLAIALTGTPTAPPGAAIDWGYTDYVVLGLLVEHVTGRPLAQDIARRVLAPLGLRATAFTTGVTARGVAQSYAGLPPHAVGGAPTAWEWASGSMVSTAADLARFYRALLAGPLLPAPLLRQAERTFSLNGILHYGFGLGLVRTRALTATKHLPFLCRDAWGQEGYDLGSTAIALSSADGRRQVVVLVDEDRASFPWQAYGALATLVDAAYCGRQG